MNDDFVKLTNAVYSLLEFFSDSDPLKNKAKEKALAIMDNLNVVFFSSGDWVKIKDCLPGIKEKVATEVEENIESMLNYLEVARNRRWISGLNFLIVKKEYEKIKQELNPFISASRGVVSGRGAEKLEPAILQEVSSPFELTERQSRILSFLKQNKKAQVSDLMAVLPKITKRTIRRDLDDLLKAGKIVRQGRFNQIFYEISDRTNWGINNVLSI